MSINKTHLLTVLLCLFTTLLSAQGFLRTDGKDIVNEAGEPYLLKGMGLGGWMLQEGYMLQTAGFANAQHQLEEKITELIGEEATREFYDLWLANHVTEADIEKMHESGFNSVRLPMHYNLYTLPIEEEPVAGEHTWLEKGFTMTDSLIAWCKARDMYVILDLHAAPGGQGNDQGISDRDEDKPSLWESPANQDKTVALWKRLAERYKDEPTIGGYDLINEVNYSLPGNVALRRLYGEITDSIRTVDNRHIIFIEGNWFANDFTGLTPPWDANMVYSPHKYWSVNDQASIQWVIDLREEHNIPIYFGETGENSNVWFRDAARLFEDYNMGWAWWPWKKVDAIAGPVSVPKTEGYQALLDYWNGTGAPQPSAAAATTALMEMAEGLELDRAIFQKDVIDALFRQVTSDEAIPYAEHNIPGIIYSSEFDMGRVGSAYFDVDQANYQVTTGNYSAWNNGWILRNDAMDLEASNDNTYSNGVHTGWLATGEWLQYTVNVQEDGVYEARVRIASNADGGAFHFQSGEADLSTPKTTPNTGDWQNFETIVVSGIPLTTEDRRLRLFVDKDGFNLGGMEFIKTGELSELATSFLAGTTLDDQTVRLTLNKQLSSEAPLNVADFTLFVNGVAVPITALAFSPDGNRAIDFSTSTVFRSSDEIRLTYTGTAITATDGSALSTFSRRLIENTVAIIFAVPGRVEAEGFFKQTGIQLESTTDAGGGENIGFLDAGDFLDYYIDVAQAGTYSVDYRTAAESEMGGIRLQLIDASGNATNLHNAVFPSTGGWQSWTTTTFEATLPAGQQHLRILITQPLFNVNWLDFTLLTSSRDLGRSFDLTTAPNPAIDEVTVAGELASRQPLTLLLTDANGRLVSARRLPAMDRLQEKVSLLGLPAGLYFVHLRADGGEGFYSGRIVKE